MSNPRENTATENLAIILQQLVRETRELKEDNRRLREEVRSQLQEREVEPNVTDTRARRRRRRTAPKDCQAAVRTIYKALLQLRNDEDRDVRFTGFAVDERFDSPTNRSLTRRLVQETIQDNGGENCEYTVPMIKLAIKRYFWSKKEDEKRQSEGTLAAHRKTCRKHHRLSMKQLSRADALDSINWNDEKKNKWQGVVNSLGYMSSEQSEEEVEDDGQRRVVFKVKPLSWERRELREGKKALDEHYCSKLSRRALLKRIKRIRSVNSSDRTRPEQACRWAVKKDTSNSITSNIPPAGAAADVTQPGTPLHNSTPR